MTSFNRSYTTYYQSAIVSIGLSCTIFKLLEENILTLKTRLGVSQD